MKQLIFLSLIASFVFSSCNRNTPKPSEVQQVGDFDSSSIAQDTMMQRTLESSYEYAKTLNVSGRLAYDVRAYGGPASEGEYAILRRAADNQADTVEKGKRQGIIVDALLAHLNHNDEEEIYIITQSVGTGAYGNVTGWGFDKEGKATRIYFPDPAKSAVRGYMGKDSFFIEHHLMVRRYPVYKENDANCCPSGGYMLEYYGLKDDKFESIKKEKV